MILKYAGSAAELRLPDGQTVARGDTVEVDDELGASLATRRDFDAAETADDSASDPDTEQD